MSTLTISRQIKLVMLSEYLHSFVLLTLLSFIPLLLANLDKTGAVLSIASILANIVVMVCLPIIASWSKAFANYTNLILMRLVTLTILLFLLIYQSAWVLCLIQALALLILSFQQVNSNRSLQDIGVAFTDKAVFKFEIGTAVVSFLVALAIYLVVGGEKFIVTHLIIFAIVGLILNLLCLLLLKKYLSGRIEVINSQKQDKARKSLSFSLKLLFCRAQLCFLAQRLMWFISPLWFAKTHNATGFINWLLVSSIGVMLAIGLVKLHARMAISFERLFSFSNLGLVFSIALIAAYPSDTSMYIAGVMCTLAIPIHRTYTRRMAQKYESTYYSAAQLIAQGNRHIRFIHIALVMVFPLAVQAGGLQLTALLSLSVITLLALSHKVLPNPTNSFLRSES